MFYYYGSGKFILEQKETLLNTSCREKLLDSIVNVLCDYAETFTRVHI